MCASIQPPGLLTAQSTDYRMIESLQVANFRGYKTIDLSGIPQFNFLVGPSGSGKTALLEALWMLGGVSPEIYFRARMMRGVSAAAQLVQDRRSYESISSTTRMTPTAHFSQSWILLPGAGLYGFPTM